jgi:site-specific recombinase XerD
MASINYYLKRPEEEKTSIICILSDGRGYRIKLYPGISIKSKHWSKKNKNVLSADPKAAKINKYLEDYSTKVFGIYLEAKINNIRPNIDYFNRKLAAEEIDASSFWQLWKAYLKSKEGVFKKSTHAKAGSLKTHLEKFEKHYGEPLILDRISVQLLEDFQNFLYNKQDLNTGSTQRYIKLFKMFLNWCFKRRHTTNTDFQNFTPIQQPDSLKVIMTDADIRKLKKVDLKDYNHLKNVRSLFLLACNCGLRYSDFSKIGKQHLKKTNGGYIIEIRQEKTDDFVSLPLTRESLQTVRALINGSLHSITNQKMNTYVKDLCEVAEIDEPCEVHTYKGKEKETETVPKYKLITTHTGRRTFATRLLTRGVPAEVVMKFTGHKDYRSFLAYVNIPKEAEMKIVRKALEGNKNMWVAS